MRNRGQPAGGSPRHRTGARRPSEAPTHPLTISDDLPRPHSAVPTAPSPPYSPAARLPLCISLRRSNGLAPGRRAPRPHAGTPSSTQPSLVIKEDNARRNVSIAFLDRFYPHVLVHLKGIDRHGHEAF